MNIPTPILKRYLLVSFWTLWGFFASVPVFASHIIGGELSYQRLSGNTFRITMDIYRDCYHGIPWFDTPAHLAIFDENGNPVPNIPASILNIQPIYSDTIPNNILSDPCLFPPDTVCVEHARYQTDVVLNGPGGFYVVYQRCCRNQSVSNIFNPSESGATYWIYISPHAKEVNNSSPTFSNGSNNGLPPVYVCVNKPLANPHAAYDADGDSLVYKFYTPFLGASFDDPQPHFGNPPYGVGEIVPPPYDTVTWIDPPYNLDSLLGPSPIGELEIDQHTGFITGFPIISGQFVIGVSVEEYRNDTLLSIIRRDFQYNVGACDTIIATIVAPDAQCDELTVNFGNATAVAQHWEWYFDWPGTTLFSNEKKPTFTFPDTGSYTVALIAQPGSQCVDTSYAEIFLQYNSLTADFSVQTFDCTNQSALLLQDLSVDNVSPPSQWLWTVSYNSITLTSTEQNPVFQVPNPSSGTVTLVVQSLNGCEQTKTLNFETGGNNPIDVLHTVQNCLGEPAELNPNGPTTGFTYSWGAPVPPGQQHLPNPIVTPLQNTTYPVTITGYNGLCQSTGSVTVEVNPTPVLAFVPDTDCDAHVVHFVNQSQNAPSGYLWNFGDPATNLDISTLANPTYTYPGYGTYTVTLMTATNSLCKDTISQTITLTEKILEAGFGFDYSNCNETSVDIQFFDETVNNQFNTVEWDWIFSGIFNGTSTQQNPSILVTQEGTLNVTLTVTTGEDCVSATAPQSLEIAFTQLPGIIDNQELLGCLNGGVTLNPGGNPAYQYLWSPATGLSCTTCPSPLANPNQTTTYTVQILNFSADTCEITRHVTVIVPGDVNLVTSGDVLTCDEQATLTAATSLQPVALAWFKNGIQVGSGPTLTVIVSGETDYVVVATDAEGCQYPDTVTVAGGPVNMETSSDQIFCSNEALDVFAMNLDSNDILSYQWTPAASINGPADVPNPDVIETPGEQMLYVEAVNQFGCAKQDSVYIAVVDENIQLAFSSQVGCSGSEVDFTNLSINAYNFVWNFGDPTTTDDVSNAVNPFYTYPDTGTYTVSLTVGFEVSCTDTFYQNVVIVAPDFIPDFTYEYVGCDVDSIEVQFHDTSINFLNNTSSWYWETSTNKTATIPDPVFTIYPGEDFFISLTIGTPNGCQGSVQKEIKLEFIQLNLSDTIVICQGDTTALNPVGNFIYEYHWTPEINISDPNTPNPLVWPAQTTTYTVDITNFAPDTCSLTRSVTVFVPQKIVVEASDDTFTCGNPVTVSANSNVYPTLYKWIASPGGATGSLPILTVTPPVDTWYTVTGTDQYNCTDTAAVFIANESVDMDFASAPAECPEEEIQLTATNNIADHDLEYIWQATPPGQIIPPANTPTVTVLTPPAGQTATYSVTATNQFGCTASQAENISSYDFVPTVMPDVLACANVPTQLNPGASTAFNYSWSPAVGLSCTDCPNPMVNVAQPANYSVTVTDSFGSELCAKVIDVVVFVPPVIAITETVDTFTCGEPIVISAQANVPATLAWFDGQSNPLGAGATLTVNPQTEETYLVVATDGFECTASDTVVVSNNQLDIVLDGNGVIDTCPMPSYNICITNLDPADILTFEWTATNGGTILSGGDTACPEVTAPQGVTAIFSANVSSQWGCTTTEQYDVTTYTFNPVIRDVITICPGVLTPINPDVGVTGYSYSWMPQTGLDCYDCPNPQATLFEDQIYTVYVQGFNGADTCSIAQTVQVKVNPLIDLQTSPPDTSICEPVDVTLAALSNSGIITEYAWYDEAGNPIGNSSGITITPEATEVYYVTATDTLGCRDTAQVNIYAYPIDISLGDRYNFCVEDAPLTIELVNNAPAQDLTVSWQPAEYIEEVLANGSIIVVNIPDTTVFTAQITNQFGCTATSSMTVYYFDIELTLDEITASEDTIIFHSGEFSQLNINYDPTYSYHWEPAAGLDNPAIHDPIAIPEVTTTYTVTVIDEGGCMATREITIYVINPECREPNIFIPNAFTPNGDGHNDVLYVRANILESLEFAVYNRWGQKVFETTDQSTGWDGTFKGKLLTPDTYGFYVKGKCYNGEEYFKKGNILLLR